MIPFVLLLHSALDAESERLVQEALDRVSKGGSSHVSHVNLEITINVKCYVEVS